MTTWTGFRTKQIGFEVEERVAGHSKWSRFALVKLSVSAITAFSNIPLQIITTLGLMTLAVSFILAIQTLYNKIMGTAVSGFATVILLLLLLNSVIMVSLGIIGTYLGNIYSELKGRPFYLIAEKTDNKQK